MYTVHDLLLINQRERLSNKLLRVHILLCEDQPKDLLLVLLLEEVPVCLGPVVGGRVGSIVDRDDQEVLVGLLPALE